MAEDKANPNDFGINLLRTFVTVVETRNYSKAGVLLGLSQPTVSSQIKRLTKELGVPLFDKSNPGVLLTAQGQTVWHYACRILALADELNVQIDRQAAPCNDIRIGVSNEVGWNIAAVLTAMSGEHPGLRVRTFCGSASDLLERLDRGELDICAVTQDSEVSAEALCRWREPLVWAAARLRANDLGEALGAGPIDIVVPPTNCASRAIMLSALERGNIEYSIRFDSCDLKEAMDAAAAGLGYIALVQSAVPPSMDVLPPGSGLPEIRDVLYRGVFVRPADRNTVTEQFAHLLAKTVVPGGERAWATSRTGVEGVAAD